MLKIFQLREIEHTKITVTLRNILYDLDSGRVDARVYKTFNDNFQLELDDKDEEKLSGKDATIVFSKVFSRAANNPDVMFKGSKIPIDADKTYTRVITAADFISYNVKSSGPNPVFHNLGAPLSPSRLNELAQRITADPSRSQIDETSLIRGAHGPMWVSVKSHFDTDTLGDAHSLRDELGLIWYENEETLVLIEIESEAVSELRAPTQFDAEPSYVYWSEGKAGDWGRTLNLRSLDKGAPEALCAAIPLGKSAVRVVGKLNSDKPEINLTKLRERAELDLKKIELSGGDACRLCEISTGVSGGSSA